MQKILYVEDDLSLIDGLQYTLESSGYAVDNARTVKEALSLFGTTITICCYWMLLCRMAQDLTSAKRYGAVQLSRLYF